MTSIVYLDVETTGLDPDRHEVWEIAYAVGDGPVYAGQVPHSTVTANAMSLELNGYHDRAADLSTTYRLDELRLREHLTGATLCASNPHFDAAFLLARWRLHNSEAPWHHRLLDIGAYAAGVLGLDHVPGLAEVIVRLTGLGYRDLPRPDHTALRDVQALRHAHVALRALRQYGPLPQVVGPVVSDPPAILVAEQQEGPQPA